MGKRNRFVTTNTVRLELSEGDWVEVKERLSYGEQQRLAGAALGKMTAGSDAKGAGAEFAMNWANYNIERLLIWIIDWSFKAPDGKDAKITRDTIGALDPATVEEIDVALTAHLKGLEAAAKNVTTPAEPETATR